MQLCVVLGQPSITCLLESELLLDHPKWMPDRARTLAFRCSTHSVIRFIFSSGSALTLCRPCAINALVLQFLALGRIGVAGITKHRLLPAMQQRMNLRDI